MSVETLEKSLLSTIIPLQDRVLVERAVEEEKSKGGIVIPDTAKEKPIKGTVRAVGPGKRLESGIQLMSVKVGDKILFGKYAGTEVKLENKEYIVMREDDIMAIITE
ncbi:MAG: co-chaperone GroES [Pseudomonadota bacterium]